MAKDNIMSMGLYTSSDNKMKSYNTIADMQSDKLRVGQVVNLLGYYSAGDGAGHQRIIASEDDGSGVQLGNGLWANIIHNGEVNVSWFGAKGDNNYNNNNEFKKFFGYMKTNPFSKFIVPDGNYLANGWYHLPSNIVLEINGNILADNNNGFTIALYDGVNEYPEYTGTHDSVICGRGTIDQRGYINTSNGATTLRLYHGKNLVVRDITLKNCVNFHFIELASDNVLIQNVKFKGQFYTESLGIRNLECIQTEFCVYDGAAGAIPYDNTPAKNIVIDGCYFGESEEGGKIYGTIGDHSDFDSLLLENITIKNCTFDKVDGNSLRNKKMLGFLCRVNNLKIYNNTFVSCGGNVLIKSRAKSNIDIVGNTFDGNINAYTFSLGNITNGNISNNLFKDTYLGVVYVGESCESLLVANNIFQNCCLKNDITQNSGTPITFFANTINRLIIKNNIFKSNSNYVDKPFHMPSNVWDLMKEFEFSDNTFNMNVVEISNYLRGSTKGYDVLFTGNKYYGEIQLNKDIRYYDRIEILYSYVDCIFTQTDILRHIKVTSYPEVQNVITIRDMNLDDNDASFALNEVLINLTNTSANISNNIKISGSTNSKKTDDTEDRSFIKIIEIRGYFNSNKILLNGVEEIVRSMSVLSEDMLKEGVLNDYNSYITELDNYEEQQRKELNDKAKAYELALQENSKLTYEEFLMSYPTTITSVYEPVIPETVQAFINKYLGGEVVNRASTLVNTDLQKAKDNLKSIERLNNYIDCEEMKSKFVFEYYKTYREGLKAYICDIENDINLLSIIPYPTPSLTNYFNEIGIVIV